MNQITILLLFICIVPVPDAAGKCLDYRINPKGNPWKKQGGGFPESGTVTTLVKGRLAL
jgi:hypothetical protein